MRFSEIMPLRLRAAVFLILGIPALTGYPFVTIADPLEGIASWGVYAVFLQLLIVWEAGVANWITMFSVACLMSLITAISGGIFEAVSRWSQGLFDPRAIVGFTYLKQFVLMLSVVPLGLFAARSFPPHQILERLIKRGGRLTRAKRILLLGIRVLNHVTEVVAGLLPLWREEMPNLFRPRTVEADKGTLKELYDHVFGRVYSAIYRICLMLLIQTLQPLPMFENQITSLDQTEAKWKE